ncbi:hypothetical protein Pcac1_g28241 [Phytophthora cactorum]|nr:hypothetical protein Pcac1_g28241 [Phytophthora cactorum]
MTVDDFLADLKAGEIVEVMLLKPETTPEELNSSSVLGEDVLEEMKKRREAAWVLTFSRTPRIPVYPLVKEFADVVIQGSIIATPTRSRSSARDRSRAWHKYCATRQWSLPRE